MLFVKIFLLIFKSVLHVLYCFYIKPLINIKFFCFCFFRNEDCIRIERLDEAKFDYSDSLKRVCELFVDEEERMKHVSGLPPDVVSCLGAALQYLAEFKLDRIIKMAGYVD